MNHLLTARTVRGFPCTAAFNPHNGPLELYVAIFKNSANRIRGVESPAWGSHSPQTHKDSNLLLITRSGTSVHKEGLSFIGKKEVWASVQKFLPFWNMCGLHKEGKAGISGETALCPGMVVPRVVAT